MYFNHDDSSVMLSWDELHQATNFLITSDLYDVDAVVGVSRGGLVPALIISQQIDKPLYVIDYSARGDHLQHKTVNIPTTMFGYLNGKTIFLIDDIADSGHTLQDLQMCCKQYQINMTTATIVFKPKSILQPDHYAIQLPAKSGWVVFPYEPEAKTFETSRSQWVSLISKLSTG